MAFGQRSAVWDCPSGVYTYAQARAIYDKIKPIRGRQVITNYNGMESGAIKPSHPLGKRSNASLSYENLVKKGRFDRFICN